MFSSPLKHRVDDSNYKFQGRCYNMGGRQDYAEGHQMRWNDVVMIWCQDIYSTVLYNISMHILNILSEEVNYEERFRLVLKNYTFIY